MAKSGNDHMPRRVDPCDIVKYLDKWGTWYLEMCLVIYTRQSCGNLLPLVGVIQSGWLLNTIRATVVR